MAGTTAGTTAVRRAARAVGAGLVLASVAAAPARAVEEHMPRTFFVDARPLPLPGNAVALPAVAHVAHAAQAAQPAQPAQPAARGATGALADASLEQLRGGTETPWSDMRLSGTVGGNTAVNVATGANTITDGAFSNASGLPMVIQNSGANVLIQNATIVNVQIQ